MLYVPSDKQGSAVLSFVAIVLWVAAKPCDLFIHVFKCCFQCNKNRKRNYWSEVQVTFELYGHFISLQVLSTVLLSEFQSFPLSKAASGKFHGSGGQDKRHCLQDQANVHMSLAWQLVLIINTRFIGTEAIVRIVSLPPCLESYPEDMGIHAWQQATLKHNKVQIVCIIYEMYSTLYVFVANCRVEV